jgi:hypothetical protein
MESVNHVFKSIDQAAWLDSKDSAVTRSNTWADVIEQIDNAIAHNLCVKLKEDFSWQPSLK